MVKYALRRLRHMVPVLLGLTLVIFFMLHLVPGDPAVIMLGNRATEESIERLRRSLGLDQPLAIQYLLFLRNLATGNLGDSLTYRQPVTSLVLDHLPTTLLLALFATLIAMAITLPLAALAAFRRDQLADQAVR